MIHLLKRRSRILILDDDIAMQKLMKALLERGGYRVDVVSKGREAIEALERNKYAVVLLDLMMPTEGGITVIRHLREQHPEILGRVIVVTASPDSVVKTVAGDVFAVLRKPFRAEELSAAVRSVSVT